MALLSEILQEARQLSTGSTVDDDGAVSITPAEAGQPTVISTNAGTPVITAADNGDITLGSGQIIRQVVSTINDVDPNNDTNLSNVTAIVNRINSAVSGALTFVKIDSKAAFDTFLAASVIDPSSVLVTDASPFDYTDTNGVVSTQITYWQGIVTKPTAGDALSSNTLATSNSANSMTGAEIAAALYAEPDTNNLTDARATVTDTIEATVTTGLAGKVNTVAGQGLSDNNFTNALATQLGNTPLDTNAALADKLSLTSTSDVILNTTSNSGGNIEFVATDAPANQRRYRFIGLNTGNLSLVSVQDGGLGSVHTNFTPTGIDVAGTITQGGAGVVDTSNTVFTNLPADTNAALAGKVNEDGDKVLSDNNFTDAEQTKLAGLSDFNGGTVTGSTVFQVSSPDALVLKVDNNLDSTGIAFQNSGNNYTGNIVRNSNSGFSILSGSDADVSNLSLSVTFGDSGVADFTGLVNANGGLTTTTINATGDISGANFTVANNEQINFSNTASGVNIRNARVKLGTDNSFNIDILNDNLTLNKRFAFTREGIEFDDSTGRVYQLRENTDTTHGLVLKPDVQNPPSGTTLFVVSDDTYNERFRVEHDGSITSSNNNLWLGTDADGSVGGRRVPKIRDYHYESIPSLTSEQIVEEWLGNSVYFIGAGAGTINMPTIVASNPTVSQFQAGDYFYVYNFNTGSDVTLSPASGQTQWMRDDVSDVVTGNIVLGFNEIFKISVANISYFTGSLGFVVRRISQVGAT